LHQTFDLLIVMEENAPHLIEGDFLRIDSAAVYCLEELPCRRRPAAQQRLCSAAQVRRHLQVTGQYGSGNRGIRKGLQGGQSCPAKTRGTDFNWRPSSALSMPRRMRSTSAAPGAMASSRAEVTRSASVPAAM